MSWLSNTMEKLRGWVMSILPVQDIFKQMGVSPQSSDGMPQLVEVWRTTYQGNPPYLKSDDKSLHFPTVISRDLAKKSIGELTVVASLPSGGERSVNHEDTQRIIDKEILPYLRDQVEYGLAMGGVVARPWFDGKRVRIGWYTADMALPIAWDGKDLTGVVLIDRITKKIADRKTYYTKLEAIKPFDGGWIITTKLYRSEAEASLGTWVPLTAIPQWEDISPEVVITGNVCPFAYMATPWANNKDLGSPQGTSIFANAMDGCLEELDRTYTNLSWEIEAGKSKVFIDDSMVAIDPKTGKDQLDPLERKLYRKVSSIEGKDLIEPYSPELRIDQFNAALKTQLSIACMLCHLDSGAYVYDQAANAITATEVRTKQQQTYGTIVDVQDQMISPFITDLVDSFRAIQILYKLGGMIPLDIIIGIDYGDSVLVDEETDRTNAQSEVTAGLRSKLSYLMEYRGMNEVEALKEIERIKAETPVITSFFDTGA